jgi:hypothetical protein
MASMGGNQDLLFALGVGALRSVDHLQTYFAVQHRHPDGRRWVDLAHFASHADADGAIKAAVAGEHATAGELRVQKVTRSTA